jgi:hypothetical protein
MSLLKDVEESFGIKFIDPELIAEINQVDKDTQRIMDELDDCQRLTSADLNLVINCRG